MPIAEKLAAVKSRIDAAAQRSGRRGTDITLVAVSKTFGAGAVREAWRAGQRDFGENKVQEALQKIAETSDVDGIRWHLIGHLQSNKAKRAVGSFACIHSVDSLDLLQRLDTAAAALPSGAVPPDVLLQVDLAREESKHGAAIDEIGRLARAALDARGLRLAGLMLLPPWSADPEQTRPWFIELRRVRDRLVNEGIPASALGQLSMGMSHDFEAAIEEGSTIVRVGTAIFGTRETRT